MRLLFYFSIALVLGIGSQNAAADVKDWGWDFSGFATLGTGKTNRDELLFMDYDGDWSFDSDTMIGLQGVVNPTDRFSLTGQIVSRGFSFDTDVADHEVEIEWLFASFDFFENGRFRVGQLRAAHQYYSDSIEVGYSYVWVRPPVDAYPFVLSPFTHFTGADYTFHIENENSDLEIKVLAGEEEGDFAGNKINLSRMVGFTLLNRWESLSVRYAFLDHTLDFYIPFYEPLIDALEEATVLNERFNEVIDQYDLDDGHMRYHSLAIDWHVGGWHILGERYEFEPPKKALDNRQRGWYISLAYPIDAVTTYVVVGAYKSIMNKDMYALVDDVIDETNQQLQSQLDTLLAIPPAFRTPEANAGISSLQAAQANMSVLRDAAYDGINLYQVSQRSYTTGVRWDFHSQAAFKAELQYTEFGSSSTGHYIPKVAVPNGDVPNNATSLTLVVDVVF